MTEIPENSTKDIEPINLTDKELRRFIVKIDKNCPPPTHKPELGNCWHLTAGIWARGYGAFSFRGGQIKSHRLSWLAFVGRIPKETPFVLHKCDVRVCCNPEHLFLGTYADNAHDMCEKGRHNTARGDDHYLRKFPERVRRGEQIKHSVLTEDLVLEIRRRHAAGGVKGCDLAKEYEVTTGTISMVINRKIWTHI
jgi:hypothetical protein